MELDSTRKSLLKIIMLILTGITLLIVVECIVYSVIKGFLYFGFIAMFLLIFLHVLMIRKITSYFLFPGSSFVFRALIRFENGKVQANQFLRILLNFRNCLRQIQDTSFRNKVNYYAMKNIKNSKLHMTV